ncbi:MAG TPA: hydroxymethylbilane synthase [Verrucomicrobiae bacterium]|nr:hydroxymethylbilane synthase [Verrucomicrobiae bacterium]
MKPLIIGTRGSPLALAQTGIVRGLLQDANPGLQIEIKTIKTSGDNFTNLSLVAGGGKGLFTKEIEEQLLRGEIHMAVHSLKDLPTILPDGLMIGAVPPREDPHDVLISKERGPTPDPSQEGNSGAGLPSTGGAGGGWIQKLPPGARVATSSLRRRAQLLARRPDLQIEEIRGNVETRLRKLAENDALQALILAAAGLRRLGLWKKEDRFEWREIDFAEMIPAVGQGAIACEVRESDDETREILALINDADANACTAAERSFLRALGGGCQVPYAAHATVDGERLRLMGAIFSPDGKQVSRVEAIGSKADPRGVGERAAKEVSY